MVGEFPLELYQVGMCNYLDIACEGIFPTRLDVSIFIFCRLAHSEILFLVPSPKWTILLNFPYVEEGMNNGKMIKQCNSSKNSMFALPPWRSALVYLGRPCSLTWVAGSVGQIDVFMEQVFDKDWYDQRVVRCGSM